MKTLRSLVAVAALCGLTACGSTGGKRVADVGGYRTGTVGAALSAMAGRGSGTSEQPRVVREAPVVQPRARVKARAAARGSTPVPNPDTVVFAAAALPRATWEIEPRPFLQRASYQPGEIATRALANGALLTPALAQLGGAPAPGDARAAGFSGTSGWALSRVQWRVLTFGMALAMLAALMAAWSATRRGRGAEPLIGAASDAGPLGPMGPARSIGPQYMLPLRRDAGGLAGAPSAPLVNFSAGGSARLAPRTGPRRPG